MRNRPCSHHLLSQITEESTPKNHALLLKRMRRRAIKHKKAGFLKQLMFTSIPQSSCKREDNHSRSADQGRAMCSLEEPSYMNTWVGGRAATHTQPPANGMKQGTYSKKTTEYQDFAVASPLETIEKRDQSFSFSFSFITILPWAKLALRSCSGTFL
jgi:hypothetical protein